MKTTRPPDLHPAERASMDALYAAPDAAVIGWAGVVRVVTPAVLRWAADDRLGEHADLLSMWHCCQMCRGRAEAITWLHKQANEIEEDAHREHPPADPSDHLHQETTP